MDFPLRITDQLREHLRALRKQRGLTQAELGSMLGVAQARIAEIEKTPGAISVDQLVRLLAALDASLVIRDLAENETPRKSAVTHKPIKAAKPLEIRKPSPIRANKGSW